MSSSLPGQGGESPTTNQNDTFVTALDASRLDSPPYPQPISGQKSIGDIVKFPETLPISKSSQTMNHHQLSAKTPRLPDLDHPTPTRMDSPSPPFASTSHTSHQDFTSKNSMSTALAPEAFPPVVLDPLLKDKMNYRCMYDPALDNSVVKKSAGPQYRHFQPSGTIISKPEKDPRLKLAYPSPLLVPPVTASQKSSLVAGLSRSSKGRQTFRSQVEKLQPYAFDKNSIGPPPPPPPCAILITGLNQLVTGEQVRNHFVKFGRVAECEIKLDPQTGGSLGVCWLKFVNDVSNPYDGSSKDSFGKKRTPSVNGSRGIQDGHQSALEAIKKSNGARIGIMLTAGPSQSSSMFKNPQKNQANLGIKCEMDGTGSKCAKAVERALLKLYPPPPTRPLIPPEISNQSLSSHQQSTDPNAMFDRPQPNGKNLSPTISVPPRPDSYQSSVTNTTPNHPAKPFEASKFTSLPPSSSSTPAYAAIPSTSHLNPSPASTPSAVYPTARDAQSLLQGPRQHQSHLSTPEVQDTGPLPTMPSAMRHRLATHHAGAPLRTEPHASEPDFPSDKSQFITPMPSQPQHNGKPAESFPVSRMPMALKTSHYIKQGQVNSGPVRGKIAVGFVAAAQNAAIVAAKKAGIQLPSPASSSLFPGSLVPASSGNTDPHIRRGTPSSTHIRKDKSEEPEGDDYDDSESEDEDAQAERLKEAEREALIASRKGYATKHGSLSSESHVPKSYQTSSFLPHRTVKADQTVGSSKSSDLAKLSVLWPNNFIGVDKLIKLEILKRLSINGHHFLTINRVELSKIDMWARVPQGPAELKEYLAEFGTVQVMTDGQMWYITFDESTITEKAFEFVNNTLFMGTKLPCEIHQPITNEEYQFLYDNKLQALPPRPRLPSVTEVKTVSPRRSPPRQSPPGRSSPQPLSDEELITRATSIILAELRATFIRDLKNRIVSGKVWDYLKEDQQKQSHRPPQVTALNPLPSSTSTSNEKHGFSLDAHQTPSLMKLPSFAKRKSATKLNDRRSSSTAPHPLPSLNESSATHPYESASEVGRPSLSRLVQDDATSVASSDQHVHCADMREPLQDDEVNSMTVLSDDDEHRSSYSVASTQAVVPVIKVAKKKVRKRFKKAVTFTSSEEEDEEELKPKSDWKRSKHNHQSPEVVLKHVSKEHSLSSKQKTSQKSGSQSPFHHKAMDESPHSPHEDASIFAPTISQSSPHTSLTQPDHLFPQSHDEDDLNPRPHKKQKRTVNRKHPKPDKPPNAYEYGVAEDEEDLYYVKLVLERIRAGQSPLPPCPTPTSTLADITGSPNKVGSNMPMTRIVSRSSEQNQTEGEDDEQITTGDTLRSHSTGSSRTEGYYHITSSQKASYLPQRNKAIIDVGAITSSNHQNTMALAASRSTRVNSRRFVINMEQNKKATGLSSVNAADAVADVLKFNQLRTRKKQLKFARSPIHDWGLYAMEMIPVGEMVIEYVGEVIRQAVADRREKAYERSGIGSSYLFRVDDDLVVDATKKGNLGRLINHCCAPNCTAKIITINGEKKIVIYAKATIELGDEVTYDYHFPKEDVKIPCLCGSSKCKGTLN